MSNSLTGVEAIVEGAISDAASALGLPAILVPALVDLFHTIAGAADVSSAIVRAKQNAVADAEDLVAEQAADQLIKHVKP